MGAEIVRAAFAMEVWFPYLALAERRLAESAVPPARPVGHAVAGIDPQRNTSEKDNGQSHSQCPKRFYAFRREVLRESP